MFNSLESYLHGARVNMTSLDFSLISKGVLVTGSVNVIAIG